jgi:hypothetical protein
MMSNKVCIAVAVIRTLRCQLLELLLLLLLLMPAVAVGQLQACQLILPETCVIYGPLAAHKGSCYSCFMSASTVGKVATAVRAPAQPVLLPSP